MKRASDIAMNETRFRELLEAYGANSSRWPVEERASAAAFLTGTAGARELLARQARIDALLDGMPDLEPSAGLARRVAEIPIRAPLADRARSTGVNQGVLDRSNVWWLPLRLRNLLMAGVAAGTLGVVAGLAQPDRVEDGLTQGNGAQSSWDAWYGVALAGDWDEELSP